MGFKAFLLLGLLVATFLLISSQVALSARDLAETSNEKGNATTSTQKYKPLDDDSPIQEAPPGGYGGGGNGGYPGGGYGKTQPGRGYSRSPPPGHGRGRNHRGGAN